MKSTDISKHGQSNEPSAIEKENVELSIDDLDDAAGGKSAPHHHGNQTPGPIGSQNLYDRMEQLRNHTFRR